MARKYTQLTIDGIAVTKKIFKRDRIGQFSKDGLSKEDKLAIENNKLKIENERLTGELEMWKRKAESLAKLIGHNKLSKIMEETKNDFIRDRQLDSDDLDLGDLINN